MWLSGAGDGQTGNIISGGFGTWRNQPVTYARIWADVDDSNQRNVWMLDAYTQANWVGTLDIACGGLVAGESWYQASIGAYDSRWQAALTKIAANSSSLTAVHLSPWHEANGTWYPWSLTAPDLPYYQTAWPRWAALARSTIGAKLKIVWSLNAANVCAIAIADQKPADFDLVGVDCYSMFPDIMDDTAWNAWFTSWENGAPRGIGAWHDYAVGLGKSLVVPEWGINAQVLSDNPYFVEKMNTAFRGFGSSLVAEAYFNSSSNTRLYPTSNAPNTAAMYESLSWGGLPVVDVHGEWATETGPAIGRYAVYLPVRLQDAAGNVIYPAGRFASGTLVAGEFTVTVPASNDPALSPQGWQLQIDVTFDGAEKERYQIPVPTGSTIELADVVLPQTLGDPEPVLIRGIAGGIAALDADGDVVNADGVKVTGGGAAGVTAVVGLNEPLSDFSCDGVNDHVQLQAAIAYVQTAGGGTVKIRRGTYNHNQLTLPLSVALEGEQGAVLKLNAGQGTSQIISANFAANANNASGSAWGDAVLKPPAYFSIRNLTLDGNAVNQPTPGARADWRDCTAQLKLWGYQMTLENLLLSNAWELALYTEHASTWENTFNQYQNGESLFSNIRAKNYWSAGWINRGPHDSTIRDVILSAYTASGSHAQWGYVQQNTANYGAQGVVAENLHVWGEHSEDGIYLDSSNIIRGHVYAEGATKSGVKLVNSSSNNFDAFVGYCANGVELYSGSNNRIRAMVESNVSGALFKLRNTAGNLLEHSPGNNPAGAIFDCTTGAGNYTGGNNILRTARPYGATLVTGTVNISDQLELIGDASSDTNDAVWFTWPMGASKVELKKASGSANGYLNLGTTELQASAGIRWAVVTKAANYTLTDADQVVLANAAGGTFTVTLLTAVGRSGKVYSVKKDSSATAVTLATTSSQTIDGSATLSISSSNQCVQVISDGANWRVI